jgi:energy-converting hydrogenase B subunit D
MMYLGAAMLLLLAITGACVVTTRNVTEQLIALSFFGLVMALVFFFYQAPDVALSQITVGAVALPLMIMLAISRMRAQSRNKQERDQ